MTHTGIVIFIIILSGLMGGITNFFLIFDFTHKSNQRWVNFFKSLFLSLCASATVPLFLQILSNNLLDQPQAGDYPVKGYFILLGFCVMAAFFSKRFLEDLYAKVNKAEQKAEDAIQQVENLESKNQEVDFDENYITENEIKNGKIATKYSLEQIKNVSKATTASKFSYRTVSGVAKETGYSKEDVIGIFQLLETLGFAIKKKNKHGNDIWKVVYE